MKNLVKIAYFLLFIAFICDLYFVYSGKNFERFFTKTLLMPLLILIYFLESKKLNNFTTLQLNKLFLVGLIFSFLGDLFLLFKWGFLFGLGSFLLAHLFYIFCFRNLAKIKISNNWFVFIGLYLVSLLAFLFPYLKEMKIPVIIYGITISTMFYFSLKTSKRTLILGAIFFVISDSVLAINLFVNQSTILSILVMITYVIAQLLLMKGILKESKIAEEISKTQ